MSGSQLQYLMEVGPKLKRNLKSCREFSLKNLFLAKLKFHLYISFDARVENVDHAMLTAGVLLGASRGY